MKELLAAALLATICLALDHESSTPNESVMREEIAR